MSPEISPNCGNMIPVFDASRKGFLFVCFFSWRWVILTDMDTPVFVVLHGFCVRQRGGQSISPCLLVLSTLIDASACSTTRNFFGGTFVQTTQFKCQCHWHSCEHLTSHSLSTQQDPNSVLHRLHWATMSPLLPPDRRKVRVGERFPCRIFHQRWLL